MSGRGATSRKAIKKNIEKSDKKKDTNYLGDEFVSGAPDSAWSLPTRRASRRRLSLTAASARTHSSDRSGASDSFRPVTETLFSTGHKDPATYIAKGKRTVAPRGRAGGVPPKSAHSTTDSTIPTGTRPSSSAREQLPASVKVWHGGGRLTKGWIEVLEHDSDLYLPSGDCLVYIGEDGSRNTEAHPVLRVHVQKLQEARCSFLSNLITFGEIDHESCSPPPSVVDVASSPPDLPLNTPSSGHSSQPARAPESTSGNPLFRQTRLSTFPTPPRSQTYSDVASSADLNSQGVDITHEIWFPTPSYIKTTHARFQHRLATRNFIALLYSKPIVGADLFDMLSELQMVMEVMYELNEPSRRPTVPTMIADYVVARHLDDVRGDLTTALSLLAWSEKLDVGWDQGYLESFVHAAGMMAKSSFDRAEFKRLTPVTRHNLEKAYNGMQIKILNAEEKLAAFSFPDLWHLPNAVTNSPAFRSSEAFRSWLVRYFTQAYGQWPLKAGKHGHWITRNLVRQLQRDFGAIYDILVNRDIIWTDNEARHTRRWEMASKTSLADVFSPDLPGIPITDMLISFDNQHGYLHIPHPYPLLPRRVLSHAAPQTKRKALFGIVRKDKTSCARDPSEQMRIALAFGDATNINKLGMALEANELRDLFLEYEKTAALELHDVAVADARLGRWLLLYGVLEVLSTLSVDTCGIKYTLDVPRLPASASTSSYFVSPSLDNCPPWPPTGSPKGMRRGPSSVREASQRLSHCWLAPLRWGANAAVDGEHAPVELANVSSDAPATASSAPEDAIAPLPSSSLPELLRPPRPPRPPRPSTGQRICELDGRLLNERERKLRNLQFEQKVLEQRREFEQYERRYGGGGGDDHNGVDTNYRQVSNARNVSGTTVASISSHSQRSAGGGGSGTKNDNDDALRPDVPLRSPLRCPTASMQLPPAGASDDEGGWV